ncbi:MAG TPA: TonB-dependent receptor [Steroidobacteraceae bacterium]|nr:TonB-dependent receptor [Steroidobacteraceae bacterium]
MRTTVLILLGAALSAGAPAWAASGADDSALEEIVVTARKREENIQRVPDSVTAFTAAQIDDRRLAQINDFLALTPNVHIVSDQDPATNIISIRGIGSNRNQAAAVAFVVDGVILPDSDAFTMDLSDAERVEVLKGPQGALYGKGAIAGAINMATRKPTNEFAADAKASYGSGHTYRVSSDVSGPLVNHTLVGRLSVSDYSTDGNLVNLYDGKGIDYDRHSKISGRLIYTPIEALSFDLRGSFYQERGSSLWFSLVDVLGTTGGEITPQDARTRPDLNGPHSTWRQIYDTSLLASYDTGAGVLSSITAYDDIRVRYREDLDQTPVPSVPDTLQTRYTHSYSQELRFTSPGDRSFRYIVGGYFQNTHRAVVTGATIDFCYFGIPIPGPCATPMFELSGNPVSVPLNSTSAASKQYAAFAQANYDLTSELELTLALRYDRVETSQLDLLSLIQDEATFSRTQPKASLAYRLTNDAMVYATYSQGFKAGTFNPPPEPGATFPLVVGSEVSKNYELGAKTEWLDRRLKANAAVYYTDYLDPQIFQLDALSGGQVTINARKARIQGFELELAARPLPHLDLNASYGYTDSKIRDFDGTPLYLGQSLPNMPKSTLNLGAQYGVAVGGDALVKGRLDYYRSGTISYQDFQNNADPNHFLFTPSYYTLDGQIGIENGHWSLTGYVHNLTDQHFATSAYSRYIAAFIFVPFGKDPIQTDPGRLYGAEVRYRF